METASTPSTSAILMAAATICSRLSAGAGPRVRLLTRLQISSPAPVVSVIVSPSRPHLTYSVLRAYGVLVTKYSVLSYRRREVMPAGSSGLAVVAQGLRKTYGDVTALD